MSPTARRHRIAVTTDVVVFTIQDEVLKVLLVRRARAPYKGTWALPGGFVRSDEDLDACARRELEEETGVAGYYLEQLYTFGTVDRDPRERVVTVAYYALIPSDELVLRAASDADAVSWFPVGGLPELAFDHAEILKAARERLSAKVDYSTIAFQFLPKTFTLGEVQRIYEAVKGEELDKRNFRRSILGLGKLQSTGKKRQDGFGRPAMTYRIKGPKSVDIIK
jgi:8-oxo-dGTP diphosphatase